MKTQSLRRRVRVVTVGSLAISLIALGGFVYSSLRARLDSELHQRLTDRAAIARRLVGRLSVQDLADRLSTDGTLVTVRTGSKVVNGVPRPPPAPGAAVGAPARPTAPKPKAKPKPPAATPAVRARGGELVLNDTLPGNVKLELAVSRADEQRALTQLLALEVLGSLVTLAVLTLALWRLLGTALAPLDTITRVALGIARGNSGERLAPERTDTELGRLAGAFDEMLAAQADALHRSRLSEERMRRFLDDASHELRSPIAGIQATSETLLRDGGDAQRREWLAVTLVREARRAGRLMGDLLEAGRAAGELDLRPREVDLRGLAREAVERERSIDSSVSLRLSPGEPCPVWVDPDRVRQVIAALLDNARRATPGGTIEVQVRRAGRGTELTVYDDGPGVPVDERRHIFERFVRLDTGRSRAQGGSGLGLAIALAIAETHGGNLTCGSSPLGGAAFTLSIPEDLPAEHDLSTDERRGVPT